MAELEPVTDTAAGLPDGLPGDRLAARDFVDRLTLYRDDDLLVLDKPAGLAVQKGTRTSLDLDAILLAAFAGAPDRPRLTHRLDRDTSGCLLVALSLVATRAIGRHFMAGRIDKEYRALTLGTLYRVFVESARASAAIGIVIAGAMILNFVVAIENIPATISAALVDVEVSPVVFLLGVNLLILLLGALLDATTLILVIVPLFLPTAGALGIDLVHFGVLVVVNAMIGLITPPYGVLLFVINAATGIPLREIIREIWGFLGALLIALGMMIFLPDLVLWLPRLMGYDG